ncbi:MAG: peptide transporter [Actinomycetia bacterium]|jgi:peptide/nickel transport system permease protein|nr:peptide transporter [Actinomycetes bacterium]
MLSYIARRLLVVIPLLFIISVFVFMLTQLIPGDPARTVLGLKATEHTVAQKRHELGIDRPAVVQYGRWLGHAVRGDLGKSWYHPTESVSDQIRLRFPVTVNMAVGAIVITILLGLPLGLLAGTRPQSLADRVVTFWSSAAIAMPDFWVAMMLIVIFAVKLKWLPAISYVDFKVSPWEWFKHLILVWIAIGVPGAASFARQLRGAVIDAMEQDYVRTARAKGLRGRTVVVKHALKNAALVPVTVLGLQFAYTLGGTVVLERIFSFNGMGAYFFSALDLKDVPIIQGVTLLVAVTFVFVNLFVDVLYAYLNPRVRLG